MNKKIKIFLSNYLNSECILGSVFASNQLIVPYPQIFEIKLLIKKANKKEVPFFHLNVQLFNIQTLEGGRLLSEEILSD